MLIHNYENVIGMPNLLLAWEEFLIGKKSRKDVQEFQFNLMDNMLSLHEDLASGTYKHGGYQEFKINDPKPRTIHKASVRDRLLHHAVYRVLYYYFNQRFIFDSYSCRISRGPHEAILRFSQFARRVSKNHTRTCWILKCDIRKFFHSIDQHLLLRILEKHIEDKKILHLLGEIIGSFDGGSPAKAGLPLGNLTSQLFCNIYMNEFDQFVKHTLRIKHYVRYADDFVILSEDKPYLQQLLTKINEFLTEKLKLQLHPEKVFIQTFSSGVDCLGWVHFNEHKVLRTKTKQRMFKKLQYNNSLPVLSSYLGLLKHGNAVKIKHQLLNNYEAK